LVFIEDGHRYELGGKPVPGVSEIIAPLGQDMDDSLDGIVEAAADRGVTGHAVIASLLMGENAEYPNAYAAHMESAERFLAEHEIEPLAIEQPFTPGIGYAGTPDLFASTTEHFSHS
jgi:hypothetical protein